MRGLIGSFSFMPLQEVLELLARRRSTGSLTCERGTIRKSVWFEVGIAVGAASNDPREHLGQLLLNFGHLTEQQLAKALQTQEETKIRLGKVLAMVSVVRPEVVRDTLALQVREVLLDAFLWDAGVFRVDDERPPEVDDLDPRIPLEEIAREAEFRATAWAAFRAQFPTGTATLAVNEEHVPRDLPAGGVEERLLALARDGKTIDEIALALHATDFHLYQKLYALNRQGVVDPALPPDPPGSALTVEPEADGEVTTRLRATFLDPPRTPRLRVSPHQIGLMRLTAAEKYLLGRCDGARNLREIIQVAPLDEGEVLRAMSRFVQARLVEV